MSRPWWANLLQWSLFAVVMTLVAKWIAASRARQRPAAESRRLRHPPATLAIGLVTSGFFAGIAVLSNIYSNQTTTIYTTLTFVGFAVLGLAVVADYCFARHEVSHDGMHYGRMTGIRGSLAWRDVARVRFSPSMKWFALTLADGRTVRVSAMHMGLPEFARLVLEHVNGAAIDTETRALLEATAEGRPPSVFG
jgi:hypothetical protein